MYSILRYILLILNIIIVKITNILIPFLIKYEMINSLCYLIILCLKELDELKTNNKEKYRILVLTKIGGIDDLMGIPKNKNNDILFLECNRSIFKKIYFSIYKIKDKKELDTKVNEILKKKYINFLTKILIKICKIYKFDGIIGFNYNYFAERDLQIACTKLKIPFLLLYKESVITAAEKKYLQYTLKKSNDKFNGYKIAVYSNDAKKDFYQTNFFYKNKIEVVGCARLNKSFSYKSKKPKKKIVYYAIQDDRGLPHRYLRAFGNKFFNNLGYHKKYNPKYNWGDMHTKVLKILKKFAVNNPEIEIIIKVKIGYLTKSYSPGSTVNVKQYSNLPKNIKLQYHGAGHQLLETSKVVIGWNSTALLEAIAANRFILLPYFHSKKIKLIKDSELALRLKNKNYGYTEDDFYKKLDFFVKKDYKKNEIYNNKQALKYYLNNADNKAGLRLYKFIRNSLKQKLNVKN